ncbi:MAG: HAD family hydrolase, partial [Bacteroidales bacterium]|nr:HAD family hydrolase [Bacteroidales bacterium]
MKKLAIFDLDGTLIDSIADLGAATNYALECHALPTHPLDTYPMRVG